MSLESILMFIREDQPLCQFGWLLSLLFLAKPQAQMSGTLYALALLWKLSNELSASLDISEN